MAWGAGEGNKEKLGVTFVGLSRQGGQPLAMLPGVQSPALFFASSVALHSFFKTRQASGPSSVK